MRRRHYGAATQFDRVTLAEIAVEVGRSEHETRHLLDKYGALIGDKRHVRERGFGKAKVTYDATVIEALRAILDQPHRQLEEPGDDWLTRYQQGRS